MKGLPGGGHAHSARCPESLQRVVARVFLHALLQCRALRSRGVQRIIGDAHLLSGRDLRHLLRLHRALGLHGAGVLRRREEEQRGGPGPGALHRAMLALTQLSNYLPLKGSFSAVSKPIFASEYALESSRRDLQNALLCTVLVESV